MTTIYLDSSTSTAYPHGRLSVTDTAYSQVKNTAYGNAAISGVGPSNKNTGVAGVGSDVGVYASGGTYGVLAYSSASAGAGVAGFGDNGGYVIGTSAGVYDQGPTGVFGQGVGSGVGVQASSQTGHALKVLGRSEFSTAGNASIAKGRSSVTVTQAATTTKSVVLTTLQSTDGKIGQRGTGVGQVHDQPDRRDHQEGCRRVLRHRLIAAGGKMGP
jgi:hypothetical protein